MMNALCVPQWNKVICLKSKDSAGEAAGAGVHCETILFGFGQKPSHIEDFEKLLVSQCDHRVDTHRPHCGDIAGRQRHSCEQ